MTAVWKGGKLRGWQRGDTFIPIKTITGLRAGDVANNYMNCGDHVADLGDERHVGEIVSITRGTAVVRWLGTSWLSDVDVHRLVKV